MYPDSPFPPSEFTFPEWQPWYQSALLEFDRKKLSHRVITAESAIRNRLASIEGDSNHHAEREAIEDALLGLNYLKRELADDYRNEA